MVKDLQFLPIFELKRKYVLIHTLIPPPPIQEWGEDSKLLHLSEGTSQGSHSPSHPLFPLSQLLVQLQYHFLWAPLQKQIYKDDLNPTSDSLVFADF